MRAILFLAFSALSIVYALWKGGKPERTAALLILAAIIASESLGVVRDFRHVPVWLAVVDGLLMVALTTLSMFANRIWVIPLAACQVASFLGHLIKLLAPGLVPLGYVFLISFWSWPMTALLILGTWSCQKRRKAGFYDQPWRTFSRWNDQSRKLQ